MTLFFTRRTYNASKKKFTNNTAELTRFVQITRGPDDRGRWEGGTISKPDWIKQVDREAESQEITIFVHGFNTSQASVLRRMAKLEKGLRAHGYRGAVIAYDWPSEGNVLAYDNDRNNVKKTAQYLVRDGVLPLMELSPRPRVNLVAHSMGAYVILRGFSEFSDAAGPGSGAWRVNEVISASGDVDRNWFGKGAWASLLMAHRAKRFTNYHSQRDGVLPISALADGFNARIGRDGLPELTHDRHVDVNSTARYLSDVPSGKRGKAASHRWWFDSDTFFNDAAATISGASAFQSRTPLPNGDFELN